MDLFPLNYRSRKVIIKMQREGKDCSSSQKNGLFQLNLKPRQIFMCCQNSHEDHSEKLVKCTTTSPHIINWGWKTRTEEWKIRLMKLRLDGRSLFVTVPDPRNIWVSLPLKTDCRGRQHILFASACCFFSPEENGVRKPQAAFKAHSWQGQHLLTWICSHAHDWFMGKSAINMQFCRCKFCVIHPLYESFQLLHNQGWLKTYTLCFSYVLGIRCTTERMSNAKYAMEKIMKW